MSSITPEKTVLYENLVKTMFLEESENNDIPFTMYEEPLEVFITACFEPPKSTSKKNRALMLSNDILPTKKPDIDNIAKVILDALNGIAYRDDTQVVRLTVTKAYNDEPGVLVTIRAKK